jgi:hypothetical protein
VTVKNSLGTCAYSSIEVGTITAVTAQDTLGTRVHHVGC